MLTLFLLLSPVADVFAQSTDASDVDGGSSSIDSESLGSRGEMSLMSDPGGGVGITNEMNAQGVHFAKNDLSSGAFVYQYAFSLPPGRNGMTPSLNLVYNSGDKNNDSSVGFGWNFDIPYIVRENKHGSDNLYEYNDFSSSISGELVQMGTTTDYRARVDDGSSLKYEFESNSWTVYDQKGTRYLFGATASARQDDATTTSRVYKWMLEEVRDTNDNYISYDYYKEDGQIYPSVITYTGHGSTDGIFEIIFNRTSAAMNDIFYYADFPVETEYKISSVEIQENNEWVRKYDLAYTTGNNGFRPLLASVTETGKDLVTSTTLSKPATTFGYQGVTSGFEVSSSTWNLPYYIYDNGPDDPSMIRVRDINGDSYPDVIRSAENEGGVTCSGDKKDVYINDTQGGWNHYDCIYNTWTPPRFIKHDIAGFLDHGSRIFDYNGDFLDDWVWARSDNDGTQVDDWDVYRNTGNASSTWATTSVSVPIGFVFGSSYADNGTQIVEVNGDGLTDIVFGWLDDDVSPLGLIEQVYLNTGAGWNEATSTEWTLPWGIIDENYDGSEVFTFSQFMDLNGDGLTDYLFKHDDEQSIAGINNGHTWIKYVGEPWTSPFAMQNGEDAEYGLVDEGVRSFDINGDGISDLIKSVKYNDSGVDANVYLGTLDRITPFVSESIDGLDTHFAHGTDHYSNPAVEIADINADGVVDVLFSDDVENVTYLSNATPFTDLLSSINTSEGATTTVEYKVSTKYFDDSSNLLNPDLPIMVTTVASMTTTDGMGNESIEEYSYAEGEYYFGSPFDRKFTGFGIVTKTDSEGNITKTYFHQGNETATSTGEFDDHISKVGKPYRIEQYDDDENLYKKTINKWDRTDLGDGASFVFLAQTTDYSYDGDSDHADKAISYTYSNTHGGVLSKTEWGRVTGTDDGSFTDTGTDKFTTTITYATSTATSTPVFYLPSQETVVDQNSVKVRESKTYYDNLSFGSLEEGNPTKIEQWATSTTYIDTEKTYNSYGLITSEKDPRDNTTTYSYDTYNLYPATTTNALSQTKSFVYDYSSGQIRQRIDSNGFITEKSFDGFDRIVEEKQSDMNSPSSLLVKTTHVYTDNVLPLKIETTQHLNTSTSTNSYLYLDALGRKLQERMSTEESGVFTVRDFSYDVRGLLKTETLPYFSNGILYTADITPAPTALVVEYSYDPLRRLLSSNDNLGVTSHTYDQWTHIVTDVLGGVKGFLYDAYDSLSNVVEYEGVNEYTTTYLYDGNKNIIRITDAEGNIRNFTYDGIGRRLTAEDLHDSADTEYGTWIYQYDEAGNITSQIDPKGQTIEFTYDNLNRLLTEDYVGLGIVEASYGYDACTNGVGLLCYATSTASSLTLTYDLAGRKTEETKTIDGNSYTTTFEYDRLGNPTLIVYPDESEVLYVYNSGGLPEALYQKENGGVFEHLVTNFDYGPNGKVVSKILANGVQSAYTYAENQLYRLTGILTEFVGGVGGDALYWEEAQNISVSENSNEEMLSDVYSVSIPDVFPVAHEEELEEEIVLEERVMKVSTSTPEVVSESSMDSEIEEDPLSIQPVVIQPEMMSVIPVTEKQFLLSARPGTQLTDGGNMKTEFIKETSDGRRFYQTSVYVSDVVYRDSDGGVAVIDSNLVEETDAWVMKKAPYSARLAKDVGIKPITFRVGDMELYFSLVGSSTVSQKTMGEKSTSEVGERIVYPAALGNGIDLEVQVDGDALRKYAVINNKDTLLSLKKEGDYIEVPFLLSSNEDIQLNSGKGELTEKEPIVSTEQVELRGENGEKAYFWAPVAFDASGNFTNISIRYEKTAEGILLTKQLPQAWMEKATYPIYTDVTVSYSSAAGDGYIHKTTATWNSAHDATSGTVDYTGTATETKTSGSSITRTAFPFDTSGLPDNAIVTAADVNIYAYAKTNKDDDGEDFIRVVQTSTASDTSLTGNDFDNIGAVDNPTAGATDKDFSNINKNSFNSFELNSTGLSWINTTGYTKLGLREGHDALDSESFGNNIIGWRTSEYSGTTLDPFLDIAYFVDTVPSAPTGLLVEEQTNPSNVTDTTPEFSAIYQDVDDGDIAIHYQIQVSTSSSMIPTYWDSTKTTLASTTVEGSRSPEISYAGPALATSTSYYWQIKFWDDDNVEGNWSATSTFQLIDEVIIDSDVIQYISYVYDDVGNITQISDSAATTLGRMVDYLYDDLYRLVKASTTVASSTPFVEAYSYSPIGNLLAWSVGGATSTYAYSEDDYTNPHAATALASTTLVYDDNGNLISRGSSSYTWNYRNWLDSVSSGGASTTYSYDHSGERVKKVSSGVTSIYPNDLYSIVDSVPTKYIYVGTDLVASIEASEASSTIHYIHADHLGSINAITDEGGDIVQVTDYYPFGAERINAGIDVSSRQFIGEHYDEETELSYLNARYYDGGRGQFLSQDPSFLDIGGPGFEQNYQRTLQQHLMNPQALNSYSYALNNPIVNSDPEGEIVPLIPIALGALAFYGGYSAGTDLYEGYTNGDDGQFAWGVVGAVGSLIPGGGAAKGATAFTDDAVRGATNLSKNFFRGGDVVFDAKDFSRTLVNGKINPSKAVEGISVNLSEKWAATKGGFATQIKSLPKGLQITQQGKNLNHYVIRPTREMTVKEFKNLINKMNSRIKSKN